MLGAEEILIDGDELARRLGVSRPTVDRWVSKRIIPAYRFGNRCTRFDGNEVRAALKKFERPAFRRLARGMYKPKASKLIRFEAEQLEFLFFQDDPAQLLLEGIIPLVG